MGQTHRNRIADIPFTRAAARERPHGAAVAPPCGDADTLPGGPGHVEASEIHGWEAAWIDLGGEG
jgi:hypothetical protein